MIIADSIRGGTFMYDHQVITGVIIYFIAYEMLNIFGNVFDKLK